MRVHRTRVLVPEINGAAARSSASGIAIALDGIRVSGHVRDVVGDEGELQAGAVLDFERGLNL